MLAALDAESVGPGDVAVILFEGTNSTETWLRRWPSCPLCQAVVRHPTPENY